MKNNKVRISYNLKNRLINMEGSISKLQYQSFTLVLNLENDEESLDVCKEWFRNKNNIIIGYYENIFPISIKGTEVIFFIKKINKENILDWKDWFIIDDIYIKGEIYDSSSNL